ncbi:MAG: M48 family metalloprotease [Acidobacteriota bacterium]
MVALLSATAYSSAGASSAAQNLVTVPEELAIGRQFAMAVEAQSPMIRDPVLANYVNHRGRFIADHSSRPDIPYFFKVIDDPEINAFTLPGGHIFLNLGMIHASEKESEMIGIVAHEIGHAAARHFVKQYTKSFWGNLAQTAGLGAYPNYYAYLAGNMFGGATFMKFSRDAEREADTLGYQFMIDSGFDPHGMVRMFERLQE